MMGLSGTSAGHFYSECMDTQSHWWSSIINTSEAVEGTSWSGPNCVHRKHRGHQSVAGAGITKMHQAHLLSVRPLYPSVWYLQEAEVSPYKSVEEIRGHTSVQAHPGFYLSRRSIIERWRDTGTKTLPFTICLTLVSANEYPAAYLSIKLSFDAYLRVLLRSSAILRFCDVFFFFSSLVHLFLTCSLWQWYWNLSLSIENALQASLRSSRRINHNYTAFTTENTLLCGLKDQSFWDPSPVILVQSGGLWLRSYYKVILLVGNSKICGHFPDPWLTVKCPSSTVCRLQARNDLSPRTQITGDSWGFETKPLKAKPLLLLKIYNI